MIQVLCLVNVLLLQAASPDDGLARDEVWGVKRLLEYHLRLRPKMAAQDVYKLLYQANFGPGHDVVDRVEVERFLREELGGLAPDTTGEPLFERISTDNRFVRVNLRRFKTLNLDLTWLVQAMVHSAHTQQPDTLGFVRQWNEFVALVRYGLIDFRSEGIEALDRQVSAGEYLPVHHSERYKELYNPAYRVVPVSVVDEYFALKR